MVADALLFRVQFEGKPEYPGASILSEIDSNLVNYSRSIATKLLHHSNLTGKTAPRVLDFGAGAGTLTQIWIGISGIAPDCVELDPNLRSQLHSKGLRAVASLSELTGLYDYIYTSNVLEHIEHDEVILAQLRDLLKTDGTLGIYVPAFEVLFTDFDESVGHFRRYRRSELREKLKRSGFAVSFSSYSDSLGFFSVAVLKFCGFSFSPGVKTSNLMKIYDRFLLPVSLLLDFLGMRLILGKNLLMTAQKNS